MYHDSLEEVNQVRSKYEAKLILAYDNYTTIKAENEVLKEKVDVLFKLGKSYINNAKNSQKEVQTNSNNEKDEDIQVIDIKENTVTQKRKVFIV